ncbi:MAG: hypothetical protein JJU28_18095 [Cyclobacteriaceae bacterium]|nr:hypothetical protein [Cyclobacteriaceae bacterium]
METLIVTVDNKKNLSFIRKLLRKFSFVLEIKSTPSTEQSHLTNQVNVAGKLSHYADTSKIFDENTVWQQIVKEKHGPH